MRKIILSLLVTSSIISFAYAAPCAILKENLTRGAESTSVSLLQDFLFAKGYLKATPNGYFGPATLAAVKLYQKSVGLPTTGAVLTLTRAALAKEVCFLDSPLPPGNTTAPQATTTTPVATTTVQVTATTTVPYVYHPRPYLTSLDKGTLFAGGTSTWNLSIMGNSFSTSSNTVYFRNPATGKKYTIGSFPSPDTHMIVLPATLSQASYSCGGTCREQIQPANYDVTVQNEGGESDSMYISVKSLVISVTSGSLSSALSQQVTGVRIGTVTFAASTPVYVMNVATSIRTDGVTKGSVSGLFYKDELTGQVISNFGANTVLGENQSKIVGIYANINSQTSGSITGSAAVTVRDLFVDKTTTFNSPEFFTSISGF